MSLEYRKVRALMAIKGLRIKDVAKKARVDPTRISVILGGHKESVPLKKKIARVLGASYDELWSADQEQ